jgi:hypothetical protein
LNTLRPFETASGALKFPGLQSTPMSLLGRTAYENSNQEDGTFDAAATANNYVLLYGDFTNFVIADRLGSTIELVSHLVGANRRPTGQRRRHRADGAPVRMSLYRRHLDSSTWPRPHRTVCCHDPRLRGVGQPGVTPLTCGYARGEGARHCDLRVYGTSREVGDFRNRHSG